MGLEKRVSLFHTALDLFGKKGPSTDRRARQEELAVLVRKDEQVFRFFDDEYYRQKDSLYGELAKYAVRNKDAFK